MIKSSLFNNYSKRYFYNQTFTNKFSKISNEDFAMIGCNTILAGIFGSSMYLDSKSKYLGNDKVLLGLSGIITTMCASGAIYRFIKILK